MGAAAPVVEPARPRGARGRQHAGAAARRELRRQIQRIEGELAEAFVAAYEIGAPRLHTGARPPGLRPRLLDEGELEAIRDDLARRLRDSRLALARRAEEQRRARDRLERMRRDPAAYRFARISCRELGEPGCGAWEVRPRLGLLGMLMGWWQVKLSSGCPLCGVA